MPVTFRIPSYLAGLAGNNTSPVPDGAELLIVPAVSGE